jgi:hypothetical protein
MEMETGPASKLLHIFSFRVQTTSKKFSFTIIYIYTNKTENSAELQWLPSNRAKVLEKSLIIIHEFCLHTSWQAATTSNLSIRGSTFFCTVRGLWKKNVLLGVMFMSEFLQYSSLYIFSIKLTSLEISRVWSMWKNEHKDSAHTLSYTLDDHNLLLSYNKYFRKIICFKYKWFVVLDNKI